MNELIRKYAEKFASEHSETVINDIPDADAAAWMEENVPHFTCSDKEIEETYYFRFWTFRKHIKTTPDGRVITEFLPPVPWAGRHNVISCPVAHHISEARWLRDRELVRDDIRYMLLPSSVDNTVLYDNPLVASAAKLCVDSPDPDFGREILPSLKALYDRIDRDQITKYGLYYTSNGCDGMEYSVSGQGLRLTMNSYMYGGAYWLSRLCAMLGDGDEKRYSAKAEELKKLINALLWDEKDGFFKCRHMEDGNADADLGLSDSDRDCMEEVGFIPWIYPGLCGEEQERAFDRLTDGKHFSAPYGITVADMSHPKFMNLKVDHECMWDGPVWPFATSQTLTAVYTLLAEKESTHVTPSDYMDMLSKYASSQHLTENGRTVNWIDENLHPFTGRWLARDLIVQRGRPGAGRGENYNHSSFCDLVLSGACGISVSGGKLTVNPLCKGKWDYFTVDNLAVGNEVFSVAFDGNSVTVREMKG